VEDGRRFRLGDLEFDAASGELQGPLGPSRLAPKAARLLELLLERPGELVSRQRLQEELWPEQHVEVDQALAYTVRQVRAALGDDGAEPRFVETLPRRGYRFIGAIEGPVVARPDAGGRRARGRGSVVVVVAVLVGLGLATWAALRARPSAAEVRPVRVALLPLGERGLEAANVPLTEALVVAMTAQQGLAVVGPATTGALRGTLRPHPLLGRELGVAYIASGGYRPAEQFLFLQLVRVADGKHVFARRYRGTPEAVRGQLDRAAAELAAAATAGTTRPAP
jgi:DNA-binding winged helix-turn-helix (wHTH) protein/TolB-like protein